MAVMTPARRHRARVEAALLAGVAPLGGGAAPLPANSPARTAYEQLLLQLDSDRQRLHDIQSIERKVELKRELFGTYAEWVTGALSQGELTGQAVQDEIVSTMLTWALDIGAWDQAIAIGAHVLRFRLSLPERFKRTAATLIAEETAEAAIKALDAGTGFDLKVLTAVSDMTATADMPDEVRAKLFKAIGLALTAKADAYDPDGAEVVAGGAQAIRTEALAAFQRALALHEKVGVKKSIEAVERALKRANDNPQGGQA